MLEVKRIDVMYMYVFFFDLRASISRGGYGDLYWMARLASETCMNG